MAKRNKPPVLRGGGYIFPTRREIEKFLNVNPAEVLTDVILETPSKQEIKEFLNYKDSALKNNTK